MTAAGGDALVEIAERLGRDETLLSQMAAPPAERPVIGILAAAGPRAAHARADYSFVAEAVREGYLLHHARSRLLPAADPDLALLAGDYLYAVGLDRLAGLGDEPAVRELSDLIALCAQVHAEARPELAGPLWLSAACAVGCGATPGHQAAKDGVRQARPDAGEALMVAAGQAAEQGGITLLLDETSEAIESAVPRVSRSDDG